MIEGPTLPALVPVLCVYRYERYFAAALSGCFENGCKVIHVHSSREIKWAFEAAMKEERLTWTPNRFGSRPLKAEPVHYLPANGLERF
mgnify:CR=1 FL=1